MTIQNTTSSNMTCVIQDQKRALKHTPSPFSSRLVSILVSFAKSLLGSNVIDRAASA